MLHFSVWADWSARCSGFSIARFWVVRRCVSHTAEPARMLRASCSVLKVTSHATVCCGDAIYILVSAPSRLP